MVSQWLHRALLGWAVFAIIAARADGQSAAAPPRQPAGTASATVEGDIYLVMESGDTKAGAGRTVYLLADTPDFRRRHAQICASHRVRYETARAADAAALQRAVQLMIAGELPPPPPSLRENGITIDSITSLIATVIRAQVPSGMAAHYRFDRVAPGRYILFAEWKIGMQDYQWWSPIVLTPGQPMRRDLDNSTEAAGQVYCGIK